MQAQTLNFEGIWYDPVNMSHEIFDLAKPGEGATK